MSVFYLGSFPPEYGGVTVKNQNLFMALEKKVNIEKVDFSKIKRKDLKELIKLLRALIGRNNKYVIGVAGKNTRKKFCKLLYFINRNAMRNSIIFLMGGTAANDIADDAEYTKYIKTFKKVYAETESMINTLIKVGVINADYYPNGRFRPKRIIEKRDNNLNKLQCVFFSFIQPEKGTDLILMAAQRLPDIDFVFYGPIASSYKDSFLNSIKKLENVKYRGVFTGEAEEVYFELNKYDVLLFPTKWKIEGVPGILVESKIAGVTAIVSDESYNSEIVHNDQGIVISENTADEIVGAIQRIDRDRSLLKKLKYGSRESAEKYYIENYVDRISSVIVRGGGENT